MTITETAEAAADRFWPKVEKTDGCWLWTAHTDAKGYGRFRYQGRSSRAHRFAYELRSGPIPEGFVIDHVCRVRNCVNPDHLEVVTIRENTMRGEGVTALHAAQTHCVNGHEFNAENTRYGASGRRYCRACVRAFSRARRARRKALR